VGVSCTITILELNIIKENIQSVKFARLETSKCRVRCNTFYCDSLNGNLWTSHLRKIE
jgi:hypothetical protein